jgi:hypothetical protein
VWKDPETFTASVFDTSNSNNITGDSKIFLSMMASNYEDSAYAFTWHANLDNNKTTFFYVNFTFSGIVNDGIMNISDVINDPYISDGARNNPNPGNIMKEGLSNGNRSIIFSVYTVRYYHLYEFSVNTAMANITSISFNYGDHKLNTI